MERCHAVVGTAFQGPQYCGYPAKRTDANGRPCCGIHAAKQEGMEWLGDRGRYPLGTGGQWRFRQGEPR